MQYLIKEFGADEHRGYAIHLATDGGNELTAGSLWNWLWRAKGEGIEISVYRVVNTVAFSDQRTALDILTIDDDGKMEFHGDWNQSTVDTMRKAEPFTMFYNLECVLDLS
jgi:hypothetical protein